MNLHASLIGQLRNVLKLGSMKSLSILFGIVCASIISQNARAAIILDADEVTSPSNLMTSTFGFVDVFVSYDGTNPAGAMVGSYNFGLDLVPAAAGNVQFLNAFLTSPATSSSVVPRLPLFAGQTPLTFTPAGPMILVADNLPGINQSTALINNRALASIRYEVLPGATPGTYNFTFQPSSTFLFDGSNTPLPLGSLLTGSITVTAPIPEPSLALLLSGLVVPFGLYRILASRTKSKI